MIWNGLWRMKSSSETRHDYIFWTILAVADCISVENVSKHQWRLNVVIAITFLHNLLTQVNRNSSLLLGILWMDKQRMLPTNVKLGTSAAIFFA
jgi:hypothetical protein